MVRSLCIGYATDIDHFLVAVIGPEVGEPSCRGAELMALPIMATWPNFAARPSDRQFPHSFSGKGRVSRYP